MLFVIGNWLPVAEALQLGRVSRTWRTAATQAARESCGAWAHQRDLQLRAWHPSLMFTPNALLAVTLMSAFRMSNGSVTQLIAHPAYHENGWVAYTEWIEHNFHCGFHTAILNTFVPASSQQQKRAGRAWSWEDDWSKRTTPVRIHSWALFAIGNFLPVSEALQLACVSRAWRDAAAQAARESCGAWAHQRDLQLRVWHPSLMAVSNALLAETLMRAFRLSDGRTTQLLVDPSVDEASFQAFSAWVNVRNVHTALNAFVENVLWAPPPSPRKRVGRAWSWEDDWNARATRAITHIRAWTLFAIGDYLPVAEAVRLACVSRAWRDAATQAARENCHAWMHRHDMQLRKWHPSVARIPNEQLALELLDALRVYRDQSAVLVTSTFFFNNCSHYETMERCNSQRAWHTALLRDCLPNTRAAPRLCARPWSWEHAWACLCASPM